MDENIDSISGQDYDTDLADTVASAQRQASARAISGLAGNPDSAIRALELQNDTGVPARLIDSDMERFEIVHRNRLTSTIISGNPNLQNYINNNSMAETVSNDDWGILDIITKTAEEFNKFNETYEPTHVFMKATSDAIKHALNNPLLGPGEHGFSAAGESQYERYIKGDMSKTEALLASWANIPFHTAPAIMAAPFHGISETIRHYGALLGRKDLGESAAKEFDSIMESEMGRAHQDIPKAIEFFQNKQERAKFEAAIQPYVEEGLPIPYGVHPEIDRLHGRINAGLIDMLDTQFDLAMKSSTRERSAELFGNAIKTAFGETTISIDANRVLELYKDRIPSPDDGLLGWMPDIADQLENAQNGMPVNIPIKDWLSKFTPEMHEFLREDARANIGGISLREMADLPDRQPSIIDSPIALSRHETGTNPIYGIGDRKLQLVSLKGKDYEAYPATYIETYRREMAEDSQWKGRVPSDKEVIDWFDLQPMSKDLHERLYGPETDFHEFKIHDEQGQTVGEMTILPKPETQELYVEYVGGVAGRMANTFGPALIRDIARQLRELYPDREQFKWVTGHRVSGAREKAEKIEEDLAFPKVKFSRDEVRGEPDMRVSIDDPLTEESHKMFQDILFHATEDAKEIAKAFNVTDLPLDDFSIYVAGNLGGSVLWHGGDIALIEAYTSAGNVVILGANSKFRTNKDILEHDNLKNPIFNLSQLARIRQAREKIKQERMALSEQNPDGPFAPGEKFSASPGMDPQLAEYAKQLLDMVGLDVRVHLTTFDDGLASNYGHDYDRIRGVSGCLRNGGDSRAGVAAIKDGEYVIAYNPSKHRRLSGKIETLAHEIGHIIKYELINKTDMKTQIALNEEWKDWYNKNKTKSATEFVRTMRSQDAAKTAVRDIQKAGVTSTAHLDQWYRLYDEFIAEGVARWATTSDEPLTLVEKLFYRIGQAMRRLYSSIKGETYLPPKQLKEFLDAQVAERKKSKLVGMAPEFIEPPKPIAEQAVPNKIAMSLDPKKQVAFPGEILDPEAFGESKFDAAIQAVQANAMGLPVKNWRSMVRAWKKAHLGDIKASLEKAKRDQTKIQTKEWKEREKQVKESIKKDLMKRPDIAADLLVGAGELMGKKIKQRIPLLASDLTPEQKAALPRHYVSEKGMPIDALADLLGFATGDHAVEALIKYNADKGQLTARQRYENAITQETDRRMKNLYGELNSNIMSAAREQAISENTVEALAAEWQTIATKAGIEKVDKELVKAAAIAAFEKAKHLHAKSQEIRRQMRKQYDAALKAFASQDYQSAAHAMQRRYALGEMEKEAKRFEKLQAKANKNVKVYSKREVKKADGEFVNWLHDIIVRTRLGKVEMTPEDLKRQIMDREGGSRTLAEFNQTCINDGLDVYIWDELLDPNFIKHVDTMTVAEASELYNTINSMAFQGQQVKKIIKMGQAIEKADAIMELLEQLEKVKPDVIEYDPKGVPIKGIESTKIGGDLKRYLSTHLVWETIFNRWDGGNMWGPWTQIIIRPIIEAFHNRDALATEIAKRIAKLPKPTQLGKKITNIGFMQPGTDITYSKFTRENLLAVMLNMGNLSNFNMITVQHQLKRSDVIRWVEQNARKEDWDYVNGIFEIYDDLADRADAMYRRHSDTSLKRIEKTPIIGSDGRVLSNGGYYPLVRHPMGDVPRASKDALYDPVFYTRAPIPAGYKKARTGAIYPISLDVSSNLANTLMQVIHDIETRPAITNASKVLFDKKVKSAIQNRAGKVYADDIEPWLRDLANTPNYISENQKIANSWVNFVISNLVGSLSGGNIGTFMKHGFTAYGLSVMKAKPHRFAHAVSQLYRTDERTMQRNIDYIYQHSGEIPRRHRHWMETIYGITGELKPEGTASRYKNIISNFASYPMAFADLVSAYPTWMSTYWDHMDKGFAHEDAVFAADKAVRVTHGSTSEPNRPAVVRESSPWMTKFYTFFNDIANRQAELVWKAGEAKGLVKEGEYKNAAKKMVEVSAGVFMFAIFPAFIEHITTGERQSDGDEKEGSFLKAGKTIGLTLSAGIVGVRDIMSYLLGGHSYEYGMTGSAVHALTDWMKDLAKEDAFADENMNKLIRDTGMFIAAPTGIPSTIPKLIAYAYDLKTGEAHAKGPWAWAVASRFGTTKRHSATFDQWRKGRVEE